MPFAPSVRTAALAFGATLLVAAGVFAATLTDRYASVLARVDPEILLLFGPCCLLIFAVIVEAIRITARGPVVLAPKARPLSWAVLSDGR